MTMLATALRMLVGLFVDDGSLALHRNRPALLKPCNHDARFAARRRCPAFGRLP
jgi:hypothetical protein